MKRLAILTLIISTPIHAQEYIDTAIKAKTNQIGVLFDSSSSNNVNYYLNESSIGTYIGFKKIILILGCSFTTKLNESNRYDSKTNLIGPVIKLNVDLYKKKRLGIPLELSFCYYNHKFIDNGGLKSNLIFTTKKIAAGVRYSILKETIHFSGLIGINYLLRKDYYVDNTNQNYKNTMDGAYLYFSVGIKYSFIKW